MAFRFRSGLVLPRTRLYLRLALSQCLGRSITIVFYLAASLTSTAYPALSTFVRALRLIDSVRTKYSFRPGILERLFKVVAILLSMVPTGLSDVVTSADTMVFVPMTPRRSGSSAVPVCLGFQYHVVGPLR